MFLATTASAEDLNRPRNAADGLIATPRSLVNAVSWGAIAAGAAAAASLSLILLILGVGLGLSSVSPWARDGISAGSFGVPTILWLTLTQLLASAMGGYLAGRLRTRWTGAHADEVYFRDTAHGFLAWAVASLATAALLTSVIGSILSTGAQAGATVASGAVGTATSMAGGTVASARLSPGSDGGPMGYFVDSLFRREPAVAGAVPSGSAGVGDAAERSSSHDAAEKARKASAYGALWLFVSLLIGAFVASLAATYGGRRRDA